ncbi:MAG: tRNA (adenosine(37)-N6)-threonylcarbamoyltransferase complex transferase subunit TsaD, partial [Candidatus Aenigmarchaeota archaeon]|nr:tRNA (adenosine(37)-N6)-threonylcarbamoyltransferase complex transferase subunit TsaD [Candidatus Aenigmarchaeota archaeon]
DMYRPKKGWGIHPTEAAEHHRAVSEEILKSVLEKAKLSLSDVDVIAFSQGPGLPPCLLAAMNFAKKLAKENKKPLIGVNHCIAHIEIGLLKTGAKDPITAYVSGGNTQIIGFVAGKYRVFGETLDKALGNALDTFARECGLEMPGGPKIEELAKKGKYAELPYVVKGMDLSFSGIVTDAIRKFKQGVPLEDLCYSLQETMFAMITEVAERALAHTGKNEILLTGGVAANKRLRKMLKTMVEDRDGGFFAVPKEFAGDNGAMIAWLGLLIARKLKKFPNLENIDINPYQRTDEVEIIWK